MKISIAVKMPRPDLKKYTPPGKGSGIVKIHSPIDVSKSEKYKKFLGSAR